MTSTLSIVATENGESSSLLHENPRGGVGCSRAALYCGRTCTAIALLPFVFLGEFKEIVNLARSIFDRPPLPDAAFSNLKTKVVVSTLTTGSLALLVIGVVKATNNVLDGKSHDYANALLGIHAGFATTALVSRFSDIGYPQATELIRHISAQFGTFIVPWTATLYLNGGWPLLPNWTNWNDPNSLHRAIEVASFYFAHQATYYSSTSLVTTLTLQTKPSDRNIITTNHQKRYLEPSPLNVVKRIQLQKGAHVEERIVWNPPIVRQAAFLQALTVAGGVTAVVLAQNHIHDTEWSNVTQNFGLMVLGTLATSIGALCFIQAIVKHEREHPTTYVIEEDVPLAVVHPQVKTNRRLFQLLRITSLTVAAGVMTIPSPPGSTMPRNPFAVATAGSLLAFAKVLDHSVDAQSAGPLFPAMKKTDHIAPALIFSLYASMWVMGMFDATPPPLPTAKDDTLFVVHLGTILSAYAIAFALGTKYNPPENQKLSTSALNQARLYFCKAPYVWDMGWLIIQGASSYPQLNSYTLKMMEWGFLGVAMGTAALKTAASKNTPSQINTHTVIQTVYNGIAIALQGKLANS